MNDRDLGCLHQFNGGHGGSHCQFGGGYNNQLNGGYGGFSHHVSDRSSHLPQTLLFHIPRSPMCTYVHLCALIRAAVTHANKVSFSREDSSQVCWDWLSPQAASKRRQEVKPTRSFLFSEATGEWQLDSHSPAGGPLCLPGRWAGWLPRRTFSVGF